MKPFTWKCCLSILTCFFISGNKKCPNNQQIIIFYHNLSGYNKKKSKERNRKCTWDIRLLLIVPMDAVLYTLFAIVSLVTSYLCPNNSWIIKIRFRCTDRVQVNVWSTSAGILGAGFQNKKKIICTIFIWIQNVIIVK